MFPKKGKVFRGANEREGNTTTYAELIARALRSELGNSHRAAKTVMHWTGASERTVKHWLSSHHGPGGDYLVVLMRQSDAVCEAILEAAGRHDAVLAARMLAAHGTMVEVMAMVERERKGPADGTLDDADRHAEPMNGGMDVRVNVIENDRVNPSPADGLNVRQRWFVAALAVERDVTAPDLARRWGVSEKTARRDIAALRRRGVIKFVGSFKRGRYRLTAMVKNGAVK